MKANGNKNQISKTLSFLSSICLPAFFFEAEATIDDKAETTKLCNAYNILLYILL